MYAMITCIKSGNYQVNIRRTFILSCYLSEVLDSLILFLFIILSYELIQLQIISFPNSVSMLSG